MENNKRGENTKDQGKEISFQWFIVSFLIHWKWFVLSIILFLLGGYIYLRYATPVYNISTNIVLKDSRRGGLNSELSYFEKLGYLDANNNAENEMEILRSRNLLETVVIEEESYIRYYVKGRFKNTDLYGGAGRKYYAAPPVTVFMDKGSINFLQTVLSLKITPTNNSTIHVDGQYGAEKFDSDFSSIPAVIKTPVGDVLLLPDDNVALRNDYPLHIQILPPLWVAQQYMGSLSEDFISKNASVIRLSLRETNTKRGENFLNRLLELYNRETLADKNKAAENASAFIKERLDELNHELLLSEGTVESYKKANQIGLDLATEASMYVSDNNEYSKKLVSLGTEELKLSYLKEEIEKNEENSKLLPAALAEGNAALVASLEKYNQKVLEKERLLAYTMEDAPIIAKVNERLALLKEDILTSIKALGYANRASKKEFEGMLYKYDSNIGDIPRKERELADLLREEIIQSNLYVNLLRQKQEIDFTLSVTTPSAKIIDSPITSGMIFPRRTYTYMMCLSWGLIFPFIIIGIRELLNYKLTREEEIRRFSEIPVIISIPVVKTKTPIVVTSHATTAIVERFRLLRTNLQFILDSPEKKTILITSTISGEGKTFIAINLALTFSLKYKTILVGLDIRRPRINNYLNLPKQMGLLSFLTGEETDLNNLIHRNINDTNLDALISGVIPLNPNELLIEQTLDVMFKKLCEQYDYIIVDSSPVGSVSDAFLLNRISNVSLFVVRNDLTPKSAISLANVIYEEKRLNNINLILNGFSGGKGRYGYGYGYGYGGYGYGGYGYGGYGYGYETK